MSSCASTFWRMDALRLTRRALVGWSDGACTALILAMPSSHPCCSVFFFALQHDPTAPRHCLAQSDPRAVFQPPHPGLRQLVGHARPIQSIFRRGRPDDADPTNYSAHELAEISVPIAIVPASTMIHQARARGVSRYTIPGAELVFLPGREPLRSCSDQRNSTPPCSPPARCVTEEAMRAILAVAQRGLTRSAYAMRQTPVSNDCGMLCAEAT